LQAKSITVLNSENLQLIGSRHEQAVGLTLGLPTFFYPPFTQGRIYTQAK